MVITARRTLVVFCMVFACLVLAGLFAFPAFAADESSASAQASGGSESAQASSAESASAGSASAESASSGAAASQASADSGPQIIAGVVAMAGERERPTCEFLEKCGIKWKLIQSVNIDPNDYDALVVPGGPDVSPSLYGAKRDRATEGCRIVRDVLYIKVIKKFVEAGKPIMGLCGGEQHINVALGGTLEQDIDGYHTGYRPINIAKGSLLYPVFGDKVDGYHYHHQSVDKLGEGLYATEWDAEDGCVEAIEHETLPIYGFQWHPEDSKEVGIKTGKAFLQVCQEYKEKSQSEANAPEAAAA